MPSTYVNNLRLEEIATGEASGTWGTKTNTSLELIGEALGRGTENLGSDADTTITIADGAADAARAMYLKITSTSLSTTRTVTLAPNTVSKLWFIENATTGSQSINISQGSGANVTIANGKTALIATDGAGSGAAVVDVFAALAAGSLTLGTALPVASGGTGSTSASDARTALGLVIGTDISAFNADTLFADVSDTLTAGFASDIEAIGNSGTGTQTLEIATAKENLKTLTINGSFTLAPQTANSVIAMITTNDGTGGYTITTSGYDKVSGTYNNAASAKHLMRSTVIDGTQVLEILEIA